MKNKTKLMIWVIIAVLAVLVLGLLCYNIFAYETRKVQNPVATLEVENYGNIKIELYPEYAPNTVANFINLINKGFYNGKTFYGKDVNAIFATQNSDGSLAEPTKSLVDSSVQAGTEQDTKYQINGEFVANHFNSASCHFQIMLDSNRNLNGVYTAFGKVVEGLDVVEKIFAIEEKPAEVKEGEEAPAQDETSIKQLATPAVIKNASVETFGTEYPMPEIHEAFDYNAFLQNYFTQNASAE